MANLSFRRFSHPETFKRIEPARLLALLSPHREFFEAHGILLPVPGGLPFFDYPQIAGVLASPGEDAPPALLDALYFIHELATEEGMDKLLEDSELRGELGHDPTPADVAVYFWLRDREALERKHAEANLSRPRTFDHFLAEKAGGLDRITSNQLESLEHSLDGWFIEHKRGRGCALFNYRRGEEMWFLIRHGAPFRREGSLVDGQPSSVYYRPERFDVVIYNSTIGELRVNTGSKAQLDLYREYFGLHLFGSVGHFPQKQKYTLEPLRSDGSQSLVCADVEGLEWITLRQIQYFWPGSVGDIEIHKSENIFAMLEARRKALPEKARLMAATFHVKFADSRRPRTVAIRVPNVASFQRDDDSKLIERWLVNRGFCQNGSSN